MKAFWTEIWLFILANIKWIVLISVGMTARIAIDSRNKRLSFREILIKIVIGFFSGFVTSWYLYTHGMETTAMWATPLATMGGEGLIIWCSQNAPKFYKYAAKKFLGMKDEDLKD